MMLLVAVLFLGATASAGQVRNTEADSLWQVDIAEVVVTATRGARDIRNVPVPTQVITALQVREQGASRLADLLAEHPGLVVTHDQFGAGIQLQGFDAAYTLILIDGEPVIGRSGGTIDLERLPVGDIERIEIVRGPSSSLYGSEALAGVINIITRRPDRTFTGSTSARMETHGTTDFTATADGRSGRLTSRLTLNRYGSNGYDLVPEVPGLTAPQFTDWSGSGLLGFEASEATSFKVQGRYATSRQVSTVGFSQGEQIFTFDEDADRTDWTIAPQWKQRLAPGTTLTTRVYAAGSSNGYTLLNPELAEESSRIDFAQWYQKAESQIDGMAGMRHMLTAGAGFVGESVRADRVQGGFRRTSNGYAFAQDQWFATSRLQLTTSLRLDVHSEYATRFSPKAAALYKFSESLRVRTSIGTGFKAPTFQQLYMDFTNPVAAYSVVGASDVASAVAAFDAAGQVAYYFVDPSTITEIRPENSVSLNAGVEWDFGRLNLQLNAFRNNVKDLIETMPIAAKPNGQNVFSYLNLNRIYTQGVEFEATYRPRRAVSVGLGLQVLDARDRDVLDAIDAGSMYQRVNGRDRRITRADYGGLFNRSRYSGTLNVTYRNANRGLTTSVRGVFRSRYGLGDLNGNLILDSDGEYASGYALINLTISKILSDRFTGQFGVKNLLGTTFPTTVPSLPGRLLFAGVNLNIRTSS